MAKKKKDSKNEVTDSDNIDGADVYETLEKSFKKRGLGRGLDALFEDEENNYPQLDEDGEVFEKPASNLTVRASDAPDSTEASKRKPRSKREINIALIYPGIFQPRKKFINSSLEELAESIKQHGLIQPILVRPHPNNDDGERHAEERFEIVAGERRWRAAQIAGLHEVPVVVKDLSDKETLEIGLIENLQREDLNAIDEASALVQLIEEFEYTQEEAGKSIGKSRSYVANMTRLMKLPDAVKRYLQDGKLSAGHARALITSDDPETLADEIVKGSLSVREVESLMNVTNGNKPKKGSKKSGKSVVAKDINTIALENEISDQLGLRVSIDMKNKSAGNVSINFKSLDQLDDVLHRLSKVS